MKFKYKLENVLKLKERIYEQLTMEMREVSVKLERQMDIRNEYVSQLQREKEAFSNMVGKSFTARDVQKQGKKINYIKIKIREVDAKIKDIKKEEEEIKQKVIAAYKDKEIQNRLKEKKFEEYMEELKAKEQNFLDEVVSNRYKANN